MTDNIEIYETANIVLAATLMFNGCHVSHITPGGRNGTMGIFAMTGVTHTMLLMFDQGRLMVDPTIFHMHLKRLTAMVRGVVQNG